MSNTNLRPLSMELILRWVARVWSIASIVVLGLFFVGEGFSPSGIDFREALGLLFFPFGVVLGMALAWWREGSGAAITIASLLAFYVISGWLRSGRMPDGPFFFLFAAPGFLFGACWLLARAAPRQST